MTDVEALSGPELEELIRRGMTGEPLDVISAMLRTVLIVPVGPQSSGFDPVYFNRDGVSMLAAFTAFELTSRVTDLAKYALTMTGRDLMLRMPAGEGIVLNPGHDIGLEILPVAVESITQRIREP
jgi:hypothetical protein